MAGTLRREQAFLSAVSGSAVLSCLSGDFSICGDPWSCRVSSVTLKVLQCRFCNALELAGWTCRPGEFAHLQEQTGITPACEPVLLACKRFRYKRILLAGGRWGFMQFPCIIKFFIPCAWSRRSKKAPYYMILADPSSISCLVPRHLRCLQLWHLGISEEQEEGSEGRVLLPWASALTGSGAHTLLQHLACPASALSAPLQQLPSSNLEPFCPSSSVTCCALSSTGFCWSFTTRF